MAKASEKHKPKIPANALAEISNVDGWQNVFTGLGRANKDKRLGARFGSSIKLDQITLELLFHEDDIVGRVVELPAQEMTREWIEIAADDEAKISKKMQELGVRAAFCEAETWARLYGGALIILGANDGQKLDMPLKTENVKAIDWLHVVDRHDVQISSTYADAKNPKYGQPEFYTFTSTDAANASGGAVMARVHESRTLRFEGALTGRRRKRENMGWSESVVQRLYEVARDFSQSHASAAVLMADFAQAIFKIKNLANMLMSDKDGLVLKRLQMLDLSRSVAGAAMLDSEEEFDRKSTPVSGYAELLDRLSSRLAAATGMPLTLLMGEAPGGLAATGNSDHRYWYNVVKNMQETKLRAPLAYLIRLIAQVVGVKPREGETEFSFTFKSLWQPTEKEIAETRYVVAQTDDLYMKNGVTDAAEIAISRFGGDQYSIETKIDQDTLTAPPGAPDTTDVVDPHTGVPSDKSVQDTALNGAQVETLRNLLKDALTGELPRETVKAAIGAAFPALDLKAIEAMLAPIKESDIAARKQKAVDDAARATAVFTQRSPRQPPAENPPTEKP